VREDHVDQVSQLATEVVEGDLLRQSGYEWASSTVTLHFSKYCWSSMVKSYATAYRIFADSVPDGAISVERCSAIDNICHGREGYHSDFFFMYVCLFTDSHVRVPFDEFTVGVLYTLNVAPTQLHPSSWASLRAFRVLAEIFRLRPSPHVFLHFYRARTSRPTKWTSLVSQSGAALFTPFCSSYKYFKNVFFKITILPSGRHYFFNRDVSKFPLYWTRDPVVYLSWPR